MSNFQEGEWTTSDGTVIREGATLIEEGAPLVDPPFSMRQPDRAVGMIVEVISGTLTPGEAHAFKEGWEVHFPNVVAEDGQLVARRGLCASHDPIAKDIEPYFQAFLRDGPRFG